LILLVFDFVDLNHYCPDKNISLLRSLTTRGCAVPPVSPEVIKILLLQRSSRLPDAPSEHVFAGE
jgi:hypothetical protein